MNKNAFKVPLLNREGVIPSEHLQYILTTSITEDVFNLVKKNPNIRYFYNGRYYAVTTIHEALIVLSAVGCITLKPIDDNTEITNNTETNIAYNYYLRLTKNSIKLLAIQTGNSGSTSNDYASLDNKPYINGKILNSGENSFEAEDFGLKPITESDIDEIDSSFVQED